MATTKKTAPHLAAQAKVNDLDEQEQAARAHRDKARAHLADLTARNQSGDHTVTGLDLMTARAEVEAAEGLADHAARVVADARADAAALLAEHVSREVLQSLTAYDPDKALQEATGAVSADLARLNDTFTRRDDASDAAGQALADAGIPAGRWMNGIRYLPVRQWETGPALPGKFNVEVQLPDGGTAWLSGKGSTRDTRRDLTLAVNDAIGQALGRLPVLPRRGTGVL